jgi:hypothetical protein
MLKAVILGIDNFSRKNIKQIEYMNRYNISFDIFTNNSLGDSQINIPRGNKVYILKKSILSRLFQILGYLLRKFHTYKPNKIGTKRSKNKGFTPVFVEFIR